MNALTMGDVAKHAKVRIETLRSYEREGLGASPPCSISNYRWPVGSAPALSRRAWHGRSHRAPETSPGKLTLLSSPSPTPAQRQKKPP